MNLKKFIEDKIKNDKTILLDGAMGTQLAEAGCQMGGENCLSNPETVQDIHRKYLNCGSELIITNTLTMNRIYIETHNLGIDVREVNLAGASLAGEVTGEGQFVLGDISSTGRMLKPNGDLSEQDAYHSFREQAEILAEGGVDGLIVETMFDLDEALCALKACKDAADLPVITSLTFNTAENGGRTIMGNTAEECAGALEANGASIVGTNCGNLDLEQTREIVAMMRPATSLPIMAKPNAGKPRLVDKETVFDTLPVEFARGIKGCLEAGASLVGGCCGTSPAHIEAVADMLKKIRMT